MVQRGLALPTRVLFLLAIAFNPFGVHLITRDSLLFLSIGFFALGVGETVRFLAAMFYLPDDLERPGRRRASVLVATFPTIGAFATFAFLQWAFGGLTAADVAAVLDGAGAITHGRARSIVFSVVAIVVHYVAIVLGVGEDPTDGGIWLMLLTLVVMFVRPAPDALGRVMTTVVAAAAIPLVWAASLSNPVILAWLEALRGLVR